MAMSPQDMDGYMALLSTKDTKEKLNVATNLINYLDDPINSIECSDIGLFIDSLIPWMQNSNNKVSQSGIDAMILLVDRMATDFRPYLSTVLPPIIDRLGDSKEMVRDKAQRLLLKLMEREVISPQSLFEKMTSAFSHKNNKIREEALSCLQRTLIEHGASSLSLSKLTPTIVKLMGDPIPTVRDAAFNTLVEMYRHVGDRLRSDLQKKQLVPVSKLSALIAKFDEMKAGGDLLPSALATEPLTRYDDPDSSIKVSSAYKSRVSSVSRRPLFSATPRQSTNSMTGQAGAVDEDSFQRAFEEVPQVQLFSHREVEEQMTQIKNIISDPNKDWDKRVEALKRVRSVLIAGASSFDEFPKLLRSLETPFETSLKDLRSQVVREACISVAYISQQLGMKCDHFAEMLLQHLINLIMNSAKVMASAGEVAIRFIIRHTHYPRLIPFITQNMTSKSKDIRRASCSFLEQLLQTWSTHSLERHIAILQDAIKKGIEDADPEARQSARKAYRNFRNHFPEQADSLLNSLDAAHKRVVNGELSLSSSSSSNSLHQQGRVGTGTIPKTRTDGIGVRRNSTSSAPVTLRSNSAIDLQAAQRAKARAQYAALARQKVGSGASLRDDHSARPKKTVQDMTSANTSPERMGRTRSRVSGVSQSQPNSRSGSPSSRLNYSTYSAARRLPFNGGRSTGTSRETSPSRGYSLSKLRGGNSTGRVSTAPPLVPSTARPVLAQRILQQSLEAESALANALTFDSMDSVDLNRSLTGNRKYRLGDDHSDDSETSSVCSERSDSFKRPCDNISEIIFNCASTHWSDRKEGLVGLQSYFINGNVLSGTELKTITDIFTKMFMDSHTKVFSLFLDALNELIVTHKEDLYDWLYILLTRLLNKLGGDLLGSIQNKIHKSLAFVRESFPHHLQMNTVMRFLVDPTQTPNTKVKVALLTFITQLAAMSEPAAIANNATTSKALAKIISWTNDTKSSELRRAAQTAVVALYNLSLPQITMMLSTLPSEYQEAAAALVRRSSTTNNSSPPSPSVGSGLTGSGNTNGGLGSPRLIQSPGTPHRPPPSSNVTDDEHLNPEEVYRSLRRTTAEIQNYSFKALDRDTTSQDSGISQMSAGPTDRLDILEERQEDHTSNTNTNTSETSLGDISYITSRLMEFNGTTKSPVGVIDFDSIDFAKDPAVEENIVQEALDVLKNPDSVTDEILLCLTALGKIAHERSTTLLRENFRVLLKILLELLERPEYKVRVWVLEVLLQMFKRRTLDQCFIGYTELLVVKVLESSCHDYKYMTRFAEACLVVMARVLPAGQVIQVVNPHILTADTPIKQLAIKMLNAVVDVNPPEVIQPHLAGIMTSLLKAYDNDDSSVRKCAVFCIVALHKQLDQEALAPYLVSLPGSKIKLLDVYIRRMRSAPTSPKNNATTA